MHRTLKQIERMPPGFDRDCAVSIWLFRFTMSHHKHGWCLWRRVWKSPALIAAQMNLKAKIESDNAVIHGTIEEIKREAAR